MASRGGDIQGFYRQRKKGITKPANAKAKTSSSKKPSSPNRSAATFGSDVTQPPALISHASLDLQDDYDANEEFLRQFDMNMAYGPCLGMTRMARWERASRRGLNPPKDVECLLRSAKVRPECLWDGRV
ncbi:hypothetical protein RJ639_046535 [Escallonia herrerae]|uniref:DNA polymerase delta subunit 4 n=1 Tax=Escallonia herrerae TaxID=1293975 RepID=A0AA89AZ70_9ASTE|nr:hypothetical protein RJ639_046535 [Escallonia herrerae]